MIGKVTTLSTLEVQPEFSMVELNVSTSYIIQTKNITKMSVYGTTDSRLVYSWNLGDDQMTPQALYVNETNAAIVALADTAANSEMILLPVFEDVISFSEAAGETAVDKYFNVDDIVFISENSAGTLARLLAVTGGFEVREYIINYNLDQIMDVVVTGTTTTTTTSTTTTSTTSTSTSTTSSTSTSTSTTTSTTTGA